MAFGLTAAGFIPKTLADVRSSLRARWRDVFGAEVNVEEESRNGQEIDIVSAALSEPWALLESLFNAFSPGGAGGVLLDNFCALAGIRRKEATKTRVALVLVGTDAVTIPVGRVVSTAGAGTRFATLEEVELEEIDFAHLWSSLGDGETLIAGDTYLSSDGGIDRVYRVIQTGVDDVVGGGAVPLTEESNEVARGTVRLAYVGRGTHFADVEADAENTGPLVAYAFTVTEIETPVTSWDFVKNVEDHDPLGTNDEEDPALRLRREVSVGKAGLSPLDAIRAEVLQVEGVTSCTVFENAGDSTVGNLTPHSLEVLVEGGEDQDVVDAIGRSKTGGGGLVGTDSGSWEDSQGESHTIAFSRPAEVDIWVAVTLKKDPDVYPSNGDDQVAAKIVELGDALGLGRDVAESKLASFCFQIPGVLEVPEVLIGLSDPPVASTTLAISTRQKAAFDTARIDVASTDSEP